MLFNNVLKVVVAALLLHYDCFATFYEHALQHVFEEFALFGGTLSHIMLANSHCAKKNYHFKTNKLPVLMNKPSRRVNQEAVVYNASKLETDGSPYISLRFIPYMTTWLSHVATVVINHKRTKMYIQVLHRSGVGSCSLSRLSWEHEMCHWAQTAGHRDSNISTQQPCASVPQHTLHAMLDWVRLRQPVNSEK